MCHPIGHVGELDLARGEEVEAAERDGDKRAEEDVLVRNELAQALVLLHLAARVYAPHPRGALVGEEPKRTPPGIELKDHERTPRRVLDVHVAQPKREHERDARREVEALEQRGAAHVVHHEEHAEDRANVDKRRRAAAAEGGAGMDVVLLRLLADVRVELRPRRDAGEVRLVRLELLEVVGEEASQEGVDSLDMSVFDLGLLVVDLLVVVEILVDVVLEVVAEDRVVPAAAALAQHVGLEVINRGFGVGDAEVRGHVLPASFDESFRGIGVAHHGWWRGAAAESGSVVTRAWRRPCVSLV
mmetsp:Transcript_32091/g.94570  ORF Transcript_32091/g.94570 Transcript_32091/m.94570 type:complete len:301 (+) Transcript_32091:3208-4110(+)